MPLVEKRYAEAMVQLALQAGEIEGYQGDLQAIVSQFNNTKEFKYFMLNPEITVEVKKDFIKKTFGREVRSEVLNFLMLVLDKGRAKHLPGILDEFVKLADKKRSILNIRIISVAPLDNTQIAKIRDKYVMLYRASAAKVVTEIDQGLLGGVKVIIGDKVVDGSVKGRLEDLKQLIIQS